MPIAYNETMAHEWYTQIDSLRQQLAEANRKLKSYEPIALYNGKSIEQYAAELTACREANEAMRAALNTVRTILQSDSIEYDDLRNIDQIIESALVLKPSDAKWEITKKKAIEPTAEAADAFWKYWRENGETHRHGYYESTWGAINAALNAALKPSDAKEST